MLLEDAGPRDDETHRQNHLVQTVKVGQVFAGGAYDV